MTLLFFVRHMNLNAQIAELVFENGSRLVDDDLPALTGCYSTEQQQMLEVVKLRIMRNGVTEVNSDGLVNFSGPLVPVHHGFLHFDELLGQWQRRINGQSRGGQEPSNGLLREVLHTTAEIAGPFVGGPIRPIVDRRKCQLIEPCRDVAL